MLLFYSLNFLDLKNYYVRFHSNWKSMAPNFVTVGVYKNRLGKIRLSDYHGKKYVVLIFYPANFTSVSPTELLNLVIEFLSFENYQLKFLQFQLIVHFLIYIIYYQTKSRWIRTIKLSFNFRFKSIIKNINY
jgi:hypothetical protein